MRRNQPDPQDSPSSDRPKFCPYCGSANTGRGLRCTVCGHQFSSAVPVADYWDSGAGRNVDDQSLGDYYTDPEPQRPPVAERTATMPTQPSKPVDPWSSAGGRLGADPGSPDAFVPPHLRNRRRRGPRGWVLGLLVLLLIAGVAIAALILVVRPRVSDRVEAATGDAISAALADSTVAPSTTDGSIVVTESEVNQALSGRQDDYKPLKEVRVQIHRTGIKVTFKLYGVSGNLTGTLDVRNGKLIIVNPKLSGVTEQMVDIDQVATEAERSLNRLLSRNNLKATDITFADNTMTIFVAPSQ